MNKSDLKGLILILAVMAVVVWSVIPQPVSAVDSKLLGVPVVSSNPGCGAGIFGLFGGSADSCLYACAGTALYIVKGVACALPTTTATATPTPTATATLTPTATSTP